MKIRTKKKLELKILVREKGFEPLNAYANRS